jgi:hypothetical protein
MGSALDIDQHCSTRDGPTMPAHRKPTELLALSGAFEKNPARRRPVGPKSDKPIGEPPAHLGDDEAAAWCELAGNMPAGVLTSGDRVALEVVARLVARSRRQGLTNGELGALRRFLAELGASPASRGRVVPVGAAAAHASGNPWDVPPAG